MEKGIIEMKTYLEHIQGLILDKRSVLRKIEDAIIAETIEDAIIAETIKYNFKSINVLLEHKERVTKEINELLSQYSVPFDPGSDEENPFAKEMKELELCEPEITDPPPPFD